MSRPSPLDQRSGTVPSWMTAFPNPAALMFVLAVANAPEAAPRVTTDTVEYCGSLLARLSTLPAARQEPSRSLAAEGERLCGSGHVRTGIAKLRRAMRAAQATP